MKAFASNLVLALAWSALAGQLGAANLWIGFLLGYLLLAWLSPDPETAEYVARLIRVVRFLGFYAKELLVSTLQVSWDVITPKAHNRPGIVAMPLDARTDAEITLLSNLITFTPGSLALDVDRERKVLLVHGLFVGDPERYKQRLKDTFERRVLELLR